MSNTKHVTGVFLAGILAFGGIFITSAVADSLLPASSPDPITPSTEHGPADTLPDDDPETPDSSHNEPFTIVGTWTHVGDDSATVEFMPGGTWVGTLGCATYAGTWQLGTRGVPAPEEGDDEYSLPPVLSGPDNLLIGPAPADAPEMCADAPAEFVLQYDTAYVFYSHEDGSFELGSTEPGAPAQQPALRFARG